jgi:hypothetical protein
MKNWEIMAVLESRLEDKVWPAPPCGSGTKGRAWAGPLRAIFLRLSQLRPRETQRPLGPVRLFLPDPSTALLSLIPGSPSDWSRLEPEEGGRGRKQSTRIGPHGASQVTWGATFRANFGWSATVLPRGRSLLPRSENLKPVNCCGTVPGSDGT